MVADLRQFFLHAAEALCKTQPFFHFKKLLFGALDAEKQKSLEKDILALLNDCNTAKDGTFVAPAEYLEVVVTKK